MKLDTNYTELEVCLKNHIRKIVVAKEVAPRIQEMVTKRHKRFGSVEVVGCDDLVGAIPHMF